MVLQLVQSSAFLSTLQRATAHEKSSICANFGLGMSPPNGDGDISNYDMWDPNQEANGTPRQPNKADLYSMDEMQSILNLHLNLEENDAFEKPDTEEVDADGILASLPTPDLHEMVLQALQDADEEEHVHDSSEKPTPGCNELPSYELSDDLKARIPKIRAIASDVDGTLLTADHGLHPRTLAAVKKAIAAAASPVRSLQHFFPATGKSRAGALYSLGPELSSLLSNLPGAFLQGLYCVDANGDVVYEKKLDSNEMVAVAEDMAHEAGLTILAYDGDTIYSTQASLESNPHHIRQVHDDWGESKPVIIETTKGYENRFHKWMVMADTPEQIQSFRPKLQVVADTYGAMTTVSIPTMLELLPEGSGKGAGVKQLCEVLGIDMGTQMLAMGDGENDLEFLKLASIGVAMGNAVDILKEAEGVDIILNESSSEGGAGIAMELFGFGRALDDKKQ
uniref:Haloacid dehalogenase-like hydrolase n=1 Tax=Entomoneis paludosa TaxID=265537 RepID=A0A7S2YF86_9STRA